MWRVRTESRTFFQDPRKWPQKQCLNSEGLARVLCSKMIIEEVIPKLAEYFKVKMRINMLKQCRTVWCILKISALFSCNSCIVCLLNCFNALMIPDVIIKIHSGASLTDCLNFEANKTEHWIFVSFFSFV